MIRGKRHGARNAIICHVVSASGLGCGDRPQASLKGERLVLVVDDDSVARTATALGLSLDGFRVVEADGAARALKLLETTAVDAVVLDQHMPGMTGLDLTAVLRASRERRLMPILFLSADDAESTRLAALRAGATDFVLKPVMAGEIAARVGAQLDMARGWSDRVNDLEARANTVARLACLPPDLSPRESAQLICEEVSRAHGGCGCTVFAWVGPERSPVALASAGTELAVDPDDQSLAARAWTEEGPWSHILSGGRRGRDRMGTVAACAALQHNGSAVGVLAIEVADGGNAHLLAAALDYARTASLQLGGSLRGLAVSSRHRDSVRRILESGAFHPAFQPIVDLSSGVVIGHEALTRLDSGGDVMQLLGDADAAGLRAECELTLLRRALVAAHGVGPGWVSVNLSPSVITEHAEELIAIVGLSGSEVVFELTENEPINDYPSVLAALAHIGNGVKLSVDDAGSGYASLRHVIDLRPEFMKLDRTWISGIERDGVRKALVAGMVAFCEQSGTALIAEGIETEAERQVLQSIGVTLGQGFLLGRPARPESSAVPAPLAL